MYFRRSCPKFNLLSCFFSDGAIPMLEKRAAVTLPMRSFIRSLVRPYVADGLSLAGQRDPFDKSSKISVMAFCSSIAPLLYSISMSEIVLLSRLSAIPGSGRGSSHANMMVCARYLSFRVMSKVKARI